MLTNPWFPRFGHGRGTPVAATITSTAVPTANKAWIMPVIFPEACTVTAITVRPNGATGNFDVGIYRSDYTKIESLGSTACADTEKTLTLATPLVVTAGAIYYVALVFSSTSEFVFNQSLADAATVDRFGVMEQASALPLPDPLVPVKTTTLVYIPYVRFTLSGLPT